MLQPRSDTVTSSRGAKKYILTTSPEVGRIENIWLTAGSLTQQLFVIVLPMIFHVWIMLHNLQIRKKRISFATTIVWFGSQVAWTSGWGIEGERGKVGWQRWSAPQVFSRTHHRDCHTANNAAITPSLSTGPWSKCLWAGWTSLLFFLSRS